MVDNNEFKKLENRSNYRENLLEDIVKKSTPFMNFGNENNFMVLAREWNSWYPSTIKVRGGCYFFNLNQEIIVIDPGFDTLKYIRDNELDVRLIRHIFVTHFHPDHFESLITLITRLTSEHNQITVYLNSSTYKQFKIYSRGFTEFVELTLGLSFNLKFEMKNPLIMVNIKVGKAFHKEIGGSMNSIGLKFEISFKKTVSYKIGFMSDTDGLSDYMEEYCAFYGDADILICHIGAIHKDPIGYKHLYKEGIIELLKKDWIKDKIILLGEFGFELATEKEYKRVFLEILPTNIDYRDLIKILNDSIKMMKKTEKTEEGYYKFLIEIIAEKFIESTINIKNFEVSVEYILPFIMYSNEKEFNHGDDPYDPFNFHFLDNFLRTSKRSFSEVDFIECWKLFLKCLVYGAHDPKKCLHFLQEQFYKWNLRTLFDGFNDFTNIFFEHFTESLKNQLITFFIESFIKYPINKDIGINTFINSMRKNIYTKLYKSARFKGLSTNLGKLFIDNSSKGIILLFFMHFIIKLFILELEQINKQERDGRDILCDHLRKISKNLILPVHPSYQIHFTPCQMEIKGRTRSCSHQSSISLKRCNKICQILIKKTQIKDPSLFVTLQEDKGFFRESKKIPSKNLKLERETEFVNVIPDGECSFCKEKEVKERETGLDTEYVEFLFESHMESIAVPINKKIKDADSLIDIFFNLDSIGKNDDYAINYIDEDLLLEKIRDNFNKEYIEDSLRCHTTITHPLLMLFKNIKKFALSQISSLDYNKLKRLFLSLLDGSYLYIINEDYGSFIYRSHYYINIFDDDDFSDHFENIVLKLSIKELYSLLDFYISKIEIEKKIPKVSMFKYAIKSFAKHHFPLLHDRYDEKNKNKYYYLVKKFSRRNILSKGFKLELDKLKILGNPFKPYISKLKDNIEKLSDENYLIFDEDYHLKFINDNIIQIYNFLKTYILNLDKTIKISSDSEKISFFIGIQKFLEMGVYEREIIINLPGLKDNYNDPLNKILENEHKFLETSKCSYSLKELTDINECEKIIKQILDKSLFF